MKKVEEILRQIVARERGIAIEGIQNTLDYIVIRDQVHEETWEEQVPLESEQHVTERPEGKVRSFLAKYGNVLGKF